MAQLRDNIQLVQERIAAAAARCGKSPDDITLVAVSKTVAVEKINQAIELGIRHIGESRIQEARQKLPEITAPVTRHLIGHLQRNKVKYAVK
ncbi:MAG: YggS family pyridoxal phosphate enzyme, partial [Calditrichaeota bacterium]|nr:YggS family pyridoxal phosphate enzyme [Calditrichota bacterium]